MKYKVGLESSLCKFLQPQNGNNDATSHSVVVACARPVKRKISPNGSAKYEIFWGGKLECVSINGCVTIETNKTRE